LATQALFRHQLVIGIKISGDIIARYSTQAMAEAETNDSTLSWAGSATQAQPDMIQMHKLKNQMRLSKLLIHAL